MADWTLQKFRERVTGDEGYRFVIHDRDSIYSKQLDASLKALGLIVLKTLYKSPQANSFCEQTDRDRTSRVFGFHDSDQRGTYWANAEKLGSALQSSTPTLQPRTGNAGQEFAEGGTSATPALHSEGLSRRSDIHPRWATSRIPSGETRRMTANCSRKLLNPFFAEVSDVFEGYMPVTTEDENEESERQ